MITGHGETSLWEMFSCICVSTSLCETITDLFVFVANLKSLFLTAVSESLVN